MRFSLLLVCAIALGCGSGESERLAKLESLASAQNEREHLKELKTLIEDKKQRLSDGFVLLDQYKDNITFATRLRDRDRKNPDALKIVDSVSDQWGAAMRRLNAKQSRFNAIAKDAISLQEANVTAAEKRLAIGTPYENIEKAIRNAYGECGVLFSEEMKYMEGLDDLRKIKFPSDDEPTPPAPDFDAIQKAIDAAHKEADHYLDEIHKRITG